MSGIFGAVLIGYARVSTADQNPDHQVDALLRAGDTLKVTRLDRLGRSPLHLVTLGAELTWLHAHIF
ncbi:MULTISPECIES: recombinase family protein [unclassified Frankia]